MRDESRASPRATPRPAGSDRALAERRFVLATDLDGTFLGGTDDDRARLYDWIEANRASVGLVFVTGRDPQFIARLCGGGDMAPPGPPVPWPEYVVGDVGTTIARLIQGPGEARVSPIAALEQEISETWGNKAEAVRAALDGHPGLTVQPTPFRYRVSYDLDPAKFDDAAVAKVEALGADHLISDNRFFDVLPRGISKGPSLLRLIDHLGLERRRVLAAGDTLNDLSMLETGLNAVAVGNSEPQLLERLRSTPSVHFARGHGAAGILEAIHAFRLHPLPDHLIPATDSRGDGHAL